MAKKLFDVEISTPTKVLAKQQAWQVLLPSSFLGQIGILFDHAPIIGALNPGYVKIFYDDNTVKTALVNYGVFRFKDNKLTIQSDFFEYSCKGIQENAIDEINEIIDEAVKDAQLTDKAKKSMSKYTKIIGLKIKETNEKKQ